MTINYDDYQSVDDLPEEVLIPAGTWRVKGKGLKSKEKSTVLTVELIEHTDDVDPDELDRWMEARDDDAVGWITFRGSERAQLAQVRKVLLDLDLRTPADLKGAEFLAELKYDQDRNDPDKMWPRWRVVGPVSE